MTLEGKGCFIWKIRDCENGDPQRIARVAKEAQLTHVLIKIANATYSFNVLDGDDLIPAVRESLRAQKIQVWGWHYVCGQDPNGEANKAIERVRELELDGYVIDAEKEYKEPGKAASARQFMTRLRHGLPNTPIALCSYRFPSYHPQLPWREFLDHCDFNMPQVYWVLAHNASDQLNRCVREFQVLKPSRPMIPVGSAFREHGWQPTPAETMDFLQTARNLNLSAVSFYSWDDCRLRLPDVWKTIQDYSWSPPPPAANLAAQYVNALNAQDVNQIIGLYNPDAVHITATRTIQGLTPIRIWYDTFFTMLLPNASFTLVDHSRTSNTINFTWTANSPEGKVTDGNDTFGLYNNKIAYHFSSFHITQ